MRLMLTTGLCGGFITFSTFSNDSIALLKGEYYSNFALYFFISMTKGSTAVFTGGYAGKHL